MGLQILEDAGVLVRHHHLLAFCIIFCPAPPLEADVFRKPICNEHPSMLIRVKERVHQNEHSTQLLSVLQHCHVGDALSLEATIEGGFAGIIVDLFSAGALIEALAHVTPSVKQPVASRCQND